MPQMTISLPDPLVSQTLWLAFQVILIPSQTHWLASQALLIISLTFRLVSKTLCMTSH